MIGAAQTNGDLAILNRLVLIPVCGRNVAVLSRGCGYCSDDHGAAAHNHINMTPAQRHLTLLTEGHLQIAVAFSSGVGAAPKVPLPAAWNSVSYCVWEGGVCAVGGSRMCRECVGEEG